MREGALGVFRGVLLPDETGPEELRAVAGDYEAMLRPVMAVLMRAVKRHGLADPGYHTNLSLIDCLRIPREAP